MNGRILVVEDEPAVSQLIKDGLAAAGFQVTAVGGAEDALKNLQKRVPDLLILDIRLGGLSGLQLLELLRKNPPTAGLPILILTSMNREKDKVAGLRLGADDYVTKPFSEAELVARVEALLRRSRGSTAGETLYRLGTLVLNVERREVSANGKAIDLTPLEFDLVAYFLKHKGRALAYETLATGVWGEDRVATRHTITVTVARIREKLGAWGKRIEPVTGMGYKLLDRD